MLLAAIIGLGLGVSLGVALGLHRAPRRWREWHSPRLRPPEGVTLLLHTPDGINGEMIVGEYSGGHWRTHEGIPLDREPRRWCLAPVDRRQAVDDDGTLTGTRRHAARDFANHGAE